MKLKKYSDIVLRLAVAFAFLYPPLDAIISPDSWIGYFPQFMRGIVPDLVLLHGFGALEVAIAVWILSGKRIFWPCLAAILILGAIVFSDLGEFEILFRDLAIALAALALALAHAPRPKQPAPAL